jgi:hypothetical protein
MPAEEFSFIRISQDDGTWAELEASWRSSCEALGEDFEQYAAHTFEILSDLVEGQSPKAWVYALRESENSFPVLCQVNRTPLPNFDGPVIRVRFVTVSPEFDLTEKPIKEYGKILIGLLLGVLDLAHASQTAARHIKLHLASPADQQFFQALGVGLRESDQFHTVQTHGAWLYIGLKEL